MVHNLYVRIVQKGETDPKELKSRQLTLQVLTYLDGRRPILDRMGMKVKINKIRKVDMQNARLLQVMKAKKISHLPALVTPNNIYLGPTEIQDVYERTIGEFQAFLRREQEEVSGIDKEDDDVENMYRKEMTFERAQRDGGNDEDTIGEGTDMMDAYRRHLERRDTRTERRGGRQRSAYVGESGGGGAPPSSRADNVGEEDDIDQLIDRLAGRIDTDSFSRAFSGGGGGSLDDDVENDGVGNSQDDLMMRAYWENQGNSM